MADTIEIKKYGVCPVCKKGEIVNSSIGYSCNYFKSMDDKCTFNVYKSYFSKEITEDLLSQLLQKGETETFNDLKKKDGSLFEGSLTLQDGAIKPKFKNKELSTPCPACGSKVETMLTGYACLGYASRVCTLFVPKNVGGVEIDQETAEILLQGKRTDFISGFQTKEKETFSSRLILSPDLKVVYNNYLCKCPKCGGDMFVSKKAYCCSNYTREVDKCDFVIWKEMLGRPIEPTEAIELATNGKTEILHGFNVKEGSIDRMLVVNEDFKIKLV